MSVEATKALLAPSLEGVHDDLGVGPGSEPVAEGFKLFPELHIVEDLSVEDDPERPVFIGKRLLAAREIDDGETRMHQSRMAVTVHPVLVRTAVPDHADHAGEEAGRRRFAPLREVDNPCDTAHGGYPAILPGLFNG